MLVLRPCGMKGTLLTLAYLLSSWAPRRYFLRCSRSKRALQWHVEPVEHSCSWCRTSTRAASSPGGPGRMGGAPSASSPPRFRCGLVGTPWACCILLLLSSAFAWMNFVSGGFGELTGLELGCFGTDNQRFLIRVNQMAVGVFPVAEAVVSQICFTLPSVNAAFGESASALFMLRPFASAPLPSPSCCLYEHLPSDPVQRCSRGCD